MGLLIFGIIFLLTALLMKPKTPKVIERAKPSLNDFDFTTRTQVRSIPILFGTAKFSGNLIYRDKLNYYEITEDGGKKAGDIVVGDRVHLTFAIAWCKNINYLKKFYRGNVLIHDLTTKENDPGWWAQGIERNNVDRNNGYTSIYLQTGKSSMRGGSNYGASLTKFIDGENNKVISDLASNISENIKFNNVAYTYFDNAFIGDNTQSLPDYKIVRSNFLIYDNFLDKPVWDTPQDGNINPISILKYLFKVFLNKNVSFGQPTFADNGCDLYYSLEDYNDITYNNKIYLSFLMTSEKTIKEWINEILKHIDGIIYYNAIAQQYVLKLFRNNYNVLNCIKVDESIYNNLKVVKKDYQDLKNKITLKYTHPETFDETSISWINEASTATEIKEETFDFMMIRNHDYAKLVLKRLIKKEGYPLSIYKFKVSAEIVEKINGNNNGSYNYDYNINLGDILNFNNNLLNIQNMAVRVIEIAGGKDDENFYDITAIEDIFDISSFANIDFQHNNEIDISYALTDLDSNDKILVVDTPAEMASLNNDSVITLIAENSSTELINGYKIKDGLTGNMISVGYNRSYGTLKYAVNDTTRLNRTTEFILENCTNFKEINGSEIDFQRMKYRGFNSANEFFCIKTITKIDETTYKIIGILRGLAETKIYNLSVGTQFYLVLNGTTANKFKSLSIIPSSSKSMYINKFNNYNISNKLLKSYTYNYTLRKPYAPSCVKFTKDLINGTTTITWKKTKRLQGRNYRRPELIKFGEDEGLAEDGVIFKINSNSLGNFETSNYSITLNQTVGQLKIKSFVAGYESREVIINL